MEHYVRYSLIENKVILSTYYTSICDNNQTNY